MINGSMHDLRMSGTIDYAVGCTCIYEKNHFANSFLFSYASRIINNIIVVSLSKLGCTAVLQH
jgi:hypothetical protein